MNLGKWISAGSDSQRNRTAVFCLGMLLVAGCAASAQQNAGSVHAAEPSAADAQIESNVVVALDSRPGLQGQQIAATTSDGDVTLSGMVRDAASKELAETVTSRITGVRSVVNNLTVATPADAQKAEGPPTMSQDPEQAQSAPMGQPQEVRQDQAAQQEQGPANAPSPDPQVQAQQPPPMTDPGTAPSQNPQDEAHQQAQGNPTAAPYGYPSGPAPLPRGQYDPGAQPRGSANQYPDQRGPNDGYDRADSNNPDNGSNNDPNYNSGNDQRYDPRYDQRNDPRNDQPGGPHYNRAPRRYADRDSGPLTLPAATMLRVRTSEFLDARRLQTGAAFEVTAANDVFLGGVLAVPRGATLHGVVTDVKASNSGAMTGGSFMTLQLTDLDLEGRSYPLITDTWTGQGPGKGAYSANNTIGGAAIGAVIGGIIGRGPGAAIGAVAGGATGAAASSASAGPRMVLAPETILTFHLTQPVSIDPVSSREAQRLASATQPGERPYLRPRGYYPPPPPPYYFPRYYVYGRGW